MYERRREAQNRIHPLVLVALIVAACALATASPTPERATSFTPTAPITRSPTVQPLVSPVPSRPPAKGSPLTPCTSPTPQTPPEGFGIEGVIAYYDRAAGAYVFTGGVPARTAPIPFPDRPASDMNVLLDGFSPDGTWLAYESGPPRPEVFLLGYRGASAKSSPDASQVLGPLRDTTQVIIDVPRWVDNRLMHVLLQAGGPDQEPIETHAFLDPFSGEWRQELLNALPRRWPEGALSVSPDLSRALYVQDLSRHQDEWRIDLVLWDYSLGRAVWRFPKVDDFLLAHALLLTNLVQWSPQGSIVAFVSLPSPVLEPDVETAKRHQVFLLMED